MGFPSSLSFFFLSFPSVHFLSFFLSFFLFTILFYLLLSFFLSFFLSILFFFLAFIHSFIQFSSLVPFLFILLFPYNLNSLCCPLPFNSFSYVHFFVSSFDHFFLPFVTIFFILLISSFFSFVVTLLIPSFSNFSFYFLAQLARAVEYTDCVSAEG